jgi:hypothetical protein
MGRVAQSWIWGAEITATLQQYARVRLDIYWPDVRLATVTRYDADGTSSPVRNCEPLWLSTAAVVYDHEAPLDVACYYRVNPVGDTSVYWDSDPVTPTANAPWLKHVFKPYLSRQVHLRVMGQREQGARRGVARPIDRADPIVVHQTRTTDSGSLVIQTDGTWAENDAIRALLADGAPLLLQQGAALGEQQLYISVDSTRAELLDNEAGWMFRRDWTLPFDVITRPAGLASGPYGINYNAISAAYLTYEHVAAGEPTYADLAAAPGP